MVRRRHGYGRSHPGRSLAAHPPGPGVVPRCPRDDQRRRGGERSRRPGPRTLERRWAAGDRIELTLPMPPRVTRPDPRIDAVRGTIALERGPIVYAVEEPDLPASVALESIEVPDDPRIEVGTWEAPLPAGAATLSLDAFTRSAALASTWVAVSSRGADRRRILERAGSPPRGPVLRHGQPRGHGDARLAPGDACGARRRRGSRGGRRRWWRGSS